MMKFSKFVERSNKKFVGLFLCKESQRLMSEWCKLNNFDITKNYSGEPTNNFEFHLTVFYTNNEVMAKNEIMNIKKIPIFFDEYDMLGKEKNIPVIKIQPTNVLLKIRKLFENHGFKDEWPSWKPHISLSYNFNGSIKGIPLPNFKIYADTIKIEDQK